MRALVHWKWTVRILSLVAQWNDFIIRRYIKWNQSACRFEKNVDIFKNSPYPLAGCLGKSTYFQTKKVDSQLHLIVILETIILEKQVWPSFSSIKFVSIKYQTQISDRIRRRCDKSQFCKRETLEIPFCLALPNQFPRPLVAKHVRATYNSSFI